MLFFLVLHSCSSRLIMLYVTVLYPAENSWGRSLFTKTHKMNLLMPKFSQLSPLSQWGWGVRCWKDAGKMLERGWFVGDAIKIDYLSVFITGRWTMLEYTSYESKEDSGWVWQLTELIGRNLSCSFHCCEPRSWSQGVFPVWLLPQFVWWSHDTIWRGGGRRWAGEEVRKKWIDGRCRKGKKERETVTTLLHKSVEMLAVNGPWLDLQESLL